MVLGKNPGVRIPGPSEASPSVRKAFQQIVTQLGIQSSPTFGGIVLPGLTADRLLSTNSDYELISTDLVSWIAGTANRVTVADDGDGTVTLSGPQDIHSGASPTFVTVDLTGITDTIVPYMSASGFADSTIYYVSPSVGFNNSAPNTYSADANDLVIGGAADAYAGMTVVSDPTGVGSIYFADGTVGADAYRGVINFNHTINQMGFGLDGSTKFRLNSAGMQTIVPLSVMQAHVGSHLFQIHGDTDTYDDSARMTLFDTSSSAARRNWMIVNGDIAYGSLAFYVSAAADGDPDPDENGTYVGGFNSSGSFFVGTAFIGDYSGGDYTKIEADGTIEFVGAAKVWDDYVTPLGPNNWNGASNNPVLAKLFDDGAGSQGVYAYVFGDGDEVIVTCQMPHKWAVGTTIQPHIHFMCTSDVDPADNFGIEFEYTWCDIDEDFSANTTLETVDISTGVNTDDRHQVGEVTAAGIDGTGHTMSSVLLCRIKRVAATSDNYAGGVAILDFDLHYEIDTMGSRQEYVK